LSSRHGSAKPSRPTSRRDSPAPASGYNSDTSNSRAEDIKMRGAYHHQGRGGPGYGHSPPYHGGRGGWTGNQYPGQGLVTNSPATYTFLH
jgi:CTD kinase subunit alpha